MCIITVITRCTLLFIEIIFKAKSMCYDVIVLSHNANLLSGEKFQIILRSMVLRVKQCL